MSNLPSSASSGIQQAISVFVHGFCYTRSFTHPYLAEQVGPLWVMRDAPRRSGKYRNEEWVAHALPADEIARLIRDQAGGAYTVSVICGLEEAQDPLRLGFKTLGYRLGSSEALMVHRLAHIPQFEAPAVIARLQTAEQAVQLARANRSRPLSPEQFLPDSPLRQYMAVIDDEVVGWVRSITVGEAAWCADMFVNPAFRRRGIARAMLSRMLTDDRLAGAQIAVLLAGQAGAKLYPVAGYQQIGTLLLFHPR